MKNSTNYHGIFSGLKSVTDGKKVQNHRKERQCVIYVSPAGVEITYTRGWRHIKTQQSFQWSEDMKIELLDDQHVKLFLDAAHLTWAIITPCDAAAVEEELIGRITTKFASYSTACLVAQHEAVCKEYTELIRQVKDTQQQLQLLQTILEEAEKQVQGFVDAGKEDFADKARLQVKKLEDQIKDKKAYIENETVHAEGVRNKAEKESGPVLDMVLIMQNRVRELYQSRVKGVKDKYKVEDLELEEQLHKMEQLAQRAHELSTLVARPVHEIQRAIAVQEEEEEEEHWEAQFEEKPKADAAPSNNGGAADANAGGAADANDGGAGGAADAAPAEPAPSNDAAPAEPAATSAESAPAESVVTSATEVTPPVSERKEEIKHSSHSSRKGHEEESDESDWDDIDEDALHDEFKPTGGEIIMSVEAVGGMVQIREKHDGDFTMVRKQSLIEMNKLIQDSSEEKIKELAALAEREKETTKTLKEMKDQLNAANNDKMQNATQLTRMEEELRRLEALVHSKEEADIQNKTHNEEAAARLRLEVQQKEAFVAAENSRLKDLEESYAKAVRTIQEQERTVAELKAQTDNLDRLRRDAEDTKKSLATKVAELERQSEELAKQHEMTAMEKEDKERQLQSQRDEIAHTQLDLRNLNDDLQRSVQQTALLLDKQREYEQNALILAQQQEQYKAASEEEKSRLEEAKRKLENDVTKLGGMISDINNERARAAEEAARAQEEAARAKEEAAQFANLSASHEVKIAELIRNMKKLEKQLAAEAEEKKKKEEEVQANKQMIEKLNEQARLEEMKRRELHNLIQEIKGNIRVYIRIRPNFKDQAGHKVYEKVLGSDDRSIRVKGEEEESSIGKGATQKTWEFEFDRVFWPDNTQHEIFSEISQLVQSALDGYKVCIFAYGQTGSGKTYTMEGPNNPTVDNEGMIPRAVTQIFKQIAELQKKGWTFECSVQFLEIYNTSIRDLLGEGKDTDDDHEIKMVKDRDGKNTKTVVSNITQVRVFGADELYPLLKKANGNRSVAATMSNERSSRSHSVFTLNLTGTNKASGQVTDGILNLIDLAGSERIDKSQVTGDRLEETKAINTSLTCLGDVIAALANGSKHIPFRNSKLTFLLQDCFGGGSKTLMFINLAPEVEHLSESVCSLRFGAKVHDCHIGQAKKNVKAADAPSAPTSVPVATTTAPASGAKKTPAKKR